MLKLSSRSVRILDFDGSVVEAQPRVLRYLGNRASVVSLKDIGPAIRYLASGKDMARFEQRLVTADRDCLTLFGSGDFHHITAALLRRFATPETTAVPEPFSVIVFDRHPDLDRRSPWRCCGSWINEALRLHLVHQIVMIGLGSEDIHGLRINVGPVGALRTGRVGFYPFDSPPSLSFFPFTGLGGVAGRDQRPAAEFVRRPGSFVSEIRWRCIAGPENSLASRVRDLLEDIPTRNVYLSLDKDCLRREDAVTNWEPGFLSLTEVVDAVRAIADEKDIIGADITGEYSPPIIARPLFRRLAEEDRPRGLLPPTEAQLRRNEETNLTLLQTLGF